MSDDLPIADPNVPETVPTARRGGALGTAFVVGLSVLLLALAVVTGLGRTLRGPGPMLLVAVTLLPYLYVAYVSAVFAAWCAIPDRKSLPVLLGLAAVAAGVLWGPSFPARPETSPGEPVTVASWNVQRLWGGDDGVDPRQCVHDALQQANPDVVALLEVSASDVASLQSDLELSCIHTDYYGTGHPDRGGLAVCVRDGLRVVGRPQTFTDNNDWHYVLAEVHDGEQVFNVLAVHLQPYWPLTGAVIGDSVTDLAQGEPGPILDVSRDSTAVVARQGAQSVALLHRVRSFTDPTILAGDFNSTRDHALHTALRRTFVDTWARGGQGFGATVRALGWLPLRVDYVYATQDFAVTGSALGPAECADHRPVISSLVLRSDER